MLAIEAQGVIGMRQLSALADAATTILTGGSAHMIVADYRERVQANAQRLRSE